MFRNPVVTLILCLIMDLIGYATYAVPVLGEFGDILWAPLSGLIFFKLFGGWKGAFGAVFNVVEEILPGTDFIPSFTIMWLWKYASEKNVFRGFGNKANAPH
jgi:hypothetical protein